jgi:glutamine amidotransferase
MINVIDYGAGNIRSVTNALNHLDCSFRVSRKPADIERADVVILPGVGAAGEAMQSLDKLYLTSPIKQHIADGKPFLGICLGLQILFTETEEGGRKKCLNVLPGKVLRFTGDVKVPHMGWNQVRQTYKHPVFTGIPDNTNFYFVHSYFAKPDDKRLMIGETDYGVPFCSAAAKGNLVAVQFHPEKSGEWGLKFFDNFFKLVGR